VGPVSFTVIMSNDPELGLFAVSCVGGAANGLLVKIRITKRDGLVFVDDGDGRGC
jgi:hypothetical protein